MRLTDYINKYKNKILNIAIVILALIIANNIYKSQNRTLESLKENKDIEMKKNTVLGDIDRLEGRINSYKNLFNKKDVSLIMNTIRGLAKDTNIKIISLRPQKEKDYPVYIKYSFDLVMNARDYHQIGKFISKIEGSPDIYMIDNINIRPLTESQTAQQTYKLTVELTLSTVFFKG